MAIFPQFHGGMVAPGIQSTLETPENQFWFGRYEQLTLLNGRIVSTAADAGNTVTTVLRQGLLLGKITTSGKLKEWNPTGTDGSQYIYGILGLPHNVTYG